MNCTLTPKLQREFEDRGISRRNFGRIATMMSAGAAALPGPIPTLMRVAARVMTGTAYWF